MSQNANIPLPGRNWTLLTNTNVTALRVQNWSDYPIYLQATVGTAPPAATDAGRSGAIKLGEDMVLGSDRTLAELFPGITGANRVYAWADVDSSASVSHA